MKDLKFFFIIMFTGALCYADASVYSQIIKTPTSFMSSILFSVSSRLSESSKSFIVAYANDTAYIKTSSEQCKPYDFLIKKKTIQESQNTIEKFYFEKCGQLSEVLSFKRNCESLIPIELQQIINGGWPTVEKCSFWEVTNTQSGLKMTYTQTDLNESLHININDSVFFYDLKINSLVSTLAKQITSTQYYSESSRSNKVNFLAIERFSPKTQVEFYKDSQMISPAEYSEGFQDYINQTVNSFIVSYGLATTLFNN